MGAGIQNVCWDGGLLSSYQCVRGFCESCYSAHPKTRAFITHCGLNSLNEASSHGVPLLAIPLFGDQLYNAAIVLKKKMGVYLDVLEINEDSVHQALGKVLNDPR